MEAKAYVCRNPCGATEKPTPHGTTLVPDPAWTTTIFLGEERIFLPKRMKPSEIAKLLKKKTGLEWTLLRRERCGNKKVFCASHGYEYVFQASQ